MIDTPPIQYARTNDGVSIGFAVSGSGPALLHLPSLVGNVQEELEIPSFHDWYARLSELYTLIRFDRRGQGLSQRTGFAESIDDETLDLVIPGYSGHKGDPKFDSLNFLP